MEGSSTKPQQELVRAELGHIFGSRVRRSVKNMRVGDVEFGEPEQILAALKILASLGCNAALPQAIILTFPPSASCHFENINFRANFNLK